MISPAPHCAAAALTALTLAMTGLMATSGTTRAETVPCIECVQVRVGPPVTIRGPFPDELDAPFTALRLADGSFRGFSANGSTYAIDGASLWDMGGPRREVLAAGAPGSLNECGSWLTGVQRLGGEVLGLVHQESICNYGPFGQTHKSMAIASSADNGLTWTDPELIITGRDAPRPGSTTGEGDCTMVDGQDGYLYAYCLRNSDWQTIVARAAADDPTHWWKYHDGAWNEPGLGGRATAIGYLGPSAGYLQDWGWVATITADPWFAGLRLSLSADKTSFVDLATPLLPIDGSDWERPADTDLIAYATILDPDTGSNTVSGAFLLNYVHVPAGMGFESRYLVQHQVSLAVGDRPVPVQTAMALTRWVHPDGLDYVTSTAPMTGDRLAYRPDAVVAYLMTAAPEGAASIKLAECSNDRGGRVDQMLAEDGGCAAAGYERTRTAGWLYAAVQPGTVPVYRCQAATARTQFASAAADCEGLGTGAVLLGYGLAP